MLVFPRRWYRRVFVRIADACRNRLRRFSCTIRSPTTIRSPIRPPTTIRSPTTLSVFLFSLYTSGVLLEVLPLFICLFWPIPSMICAFFVPSFSLAKRNSDLWSQSRFFLLPPPHYVTYLLFYGE